MKTIQPLLLVLCLCATASGQSAATIERFKTRTTAAEREQIMEKASPAEREVLLAIDMHQMLVRQEGSEENLKVARERAVARARGFKKLEDLFNQRFMLWQYDTSSFFVNLGKQAHPSDLQKATGFQMQQKVAAYDTMRQEVHPLIYRLAFSAQAAEVEKAAEKVHAEIMALINSSSPETAQQREAIDRQVDKIYGKLRQLPVLPASELQKQYDQFPEAKLRTGGLNNANDEE